MEQRHVIQLFLWIIYLVIAHECHYPTIVTPKELPKACLWIKICEVAYLHQEIGEGVIDTVKYHNETYFSSCNFMRHLCRRKNRTTRSVSMKCQGKNNSFTNFGRSAMIVETNYLMHHLSLHEREFLDAVLLLKENKLDYSEYMLIASEEIISLRNTNNEIISEEYTFNEMWLNHISQNSILNHEFKRISNNNFTSGYIILVSFVSIFSIWVLIGVVINYHTLRNLQQFYPNIYCDYVWYCFHPAFSLLAVSEVFLKNSPQLEIQICFIEDLLANTHSQEPIKNPVIDKIKISNDVTDYFEGYEIPKQNDNNSIRVFHEEW